MDKNITRDELLNELCLAFSDLQPIQEGEFTIKEVSKAMGVHPSTLFRRVEDGIIPKGWEIVERKGSQGQKTKCLRKVEPFGNPE